MKLTINSKINSVTYTFEKKVVLIGTGNSSEIDLILNNSGPDCIQIKILNQKDYFLAINVGNNSKIKLNGLTFRKKILKSHDILQVEENTIEFESEPSEEIDDNIGSQPYYISDDFDDEGENWSPAEEKKKNIFQYETSNANRWKLLSAIVFSIFSCILIVFSVFYVNIIEITEQEEIKAAEGVADVAMALTYAQINHINPLTQNWSNPEFLKNNIAAIVPSDYSFLANIDSHGVFSNCPYLLRIYTNNDFSSFLVIALPESSLLQSLIPKNAIFVHSKTMELRKIEDLKALNRLLVNPNTLEGTNGIEIMNLVKNGILIPLSTLSSGRKTHEFTPPGALALRRPGSENLIYNAPRYYQFSETYVRRALSLTKSTEIGSHELSRLQQEMLQMSKLPNLVLYSSAGIESAIQAERAFAAFAPFAKFLNAYLIFNSQGNIIGSRLIMEEDSQKQPNFSNYQISQLENAFRTDTLNESQDELIADSRGQNVESKHPLIFQLSVLTSSRSNSLKLIASKINDLLNEQISEYKPEFSANLADLAIQFQQQDIEEKEKIKKTLATLYADYSTFPLAEILSLTKAAGLEQIVSELLADQVEVLNEEDLSDELVGAQLQMIRKAKTFSELDESITKAVELMDLKYIPKPEQLIAYQNQTKLLVADKLEEFLLSFQFQLGGHELQLHNRDILNHILETSWVTDPYEASFYLNEFDFLQTEQG